MNRIPSPLRFFTKHFATARIYPKEQPQKTDEKSSYYTAKDVQFCPNRSKEIGQNHVVEASSVAYDDATFIDAKSADVSGDEAHMKAFQADNSVSLHSVMQSNVPDPFSAGGKSPTHLNMPGGSSSRDHKYMSGRMQNVHQSKQ